MIGIVLVRVVVGWTLVEALVRPVIVEMLNIVIQHCPGVLLGVQGDVVAEHPAGVVPAPRRL